MNNLDKTFINTIKSYIEKYKYDLFQSSYGGYICKDIYIQYISKEQLLLYLNNKLIGIYPANTFDLDRLKFLIDQNYSVLKEQFILKNQEVNNV